MTKSGCLKLKNLMELLKEVCAETTSGTLDVKSYYGMGSIYIRQGQIAMATSSQSTERLGRSAVDLGHITEVQLQQALSLQKKEKKGAHLGDILVELNFIDVPDLEKLIRRQIKEIIYGMNFWHDGFFRIDPDVDHTIPSTIVVDPKTLDMDELEDLLTRPEDKDGRSGKNRQKETADSIKGEISKKIEDLSDKLRSFRPNEFILLVEDELLMRQIITDKLNDFGFTVDSVPTPTEALEKIAEYEAGGRSPIVVTDLVMPALSGKGMFGGMELLEILQEKYPHIPVIMTTAYPDPNTKQKALFWGVYYYIAKPDRSNASPEQLDNLFNNYMEELSLSIENIIRRREVYFEKDQLDIIRNQLVGDLFTTKVELSEVEKTMESKVGELNFLKLTSDSLIKDRNVNAVSENILEYASRDLDRVIIFLAKKTGFFGYKGKDRAGGEKDSVFQEALKKILFHPRDIDIVGKVIREKTGYEGWVDPSLLPVIKELGRQIPEKILLIPIVVEKKVVGLFYGDTMPGSPPSKSIDAIMILLNLASLSMEIAHQQTVISRISADRAV